MLYGLQTSFGNLIGAETYQQLAAFGYQMARIDAQGCTADDAALLAMEAVDAGLTPLIILKHPDQMALLPDGAEVEVLNEPDLNGPDPAAYILLARAFDAAANGRPLWGPCASNLSKRGFDYLDATVSALPPSFRISLHRYSYGAFPSDAHPPAASREAEVDRLKRIIGDRPFGLSESGFHQARQPQYGGWRKNFRYWDITLSDQQQAENLIVDGQFWERHGAAFWVIFQIDDGPTGIPEHQFGIRTFHGIWKPSAPR